MACATYVGHSNCLKGFECELCGWETDCDREHMDCEGNSICHLCAETHNELCEENTADVEFAEC